MTATTLHHPHHPGFGPGGCLPAPDHHCFPGPRGPRPWEPRPWDPCPGPWPHPHDTHHDTLPDADLDPHDHCCRPWWRDDTRGYGIDLDGDGRYTAGRDGILAFDFNRDGRISDEELQRSNEALKAFGGNYDLDGDGRTTLFEWMRGNELRRRMQALDRNHDGSLSTDELAAGGARMVIDHDRDGHADRNETYSVYSFPGPWGGRRRLQEVDPWCGHAHTSPNWPWWRRDLQPLLFA